ncbi:MAG TPA: TIGR02757 family protein, partial [Helicobacteraceae bacterium]|nr:TIGR02757 family protein [Helicobacteraceae bacterium]
MIVRQKLRQVKARLDKEVDLRNQTDEIDVEKLDPLYVAHQYQDEWVSLICALFAYGNVKAIVRFLESLDFSLLDASEKQIDTALSQHYYRFQNTQDIKALFIALSRLKTHTTLEAIFKEAYNVSHNIFDGINALIEALQLSNPYNSRGYAFLIGKPITKTKGNSCMKRWLLFLRWMVRHDRIDMGLWSDILPRHLVMPLDTHTFNVSRKLG